MTKQFEQRKVHGITHHDEYTLAWFAAEAKRTARPSADVIDFEIFKVAREIGATIQTGE